MKPVAIFRFSAIEGPGYLAEFLDRHGIAWQLIAIDGEETVPTSVSAFSGLVLMGGPMSVNDDLPWISPLLALIRSAVDSGVPVLGHCLGGQLMAKALGGQVTANPVKEFGWGDVVLSAGEDARQWFGPVERWRAFHWHGETFSLPDGARHLLSSRHCRNQAFVLDDKHLAMQCHIEMTAEMIKQWCQEGGHEIAASLPGSGTQPVPDILEEADMRLSGLQQVADTVYTRWIAGLAR